MTEPRTPSTSIASVVAICAGLMGIMGSCTAMLGTGVVAVRVFTQTEAKVDAVEVRLNKVEHTATTTAESFNGPARAEHQKLVGRVDLLDAEVKTKANDEAMRSLASEMRQQFAHVIGLLNEVREDRNGSK